MAIFLGLDPGTTRAGYGLINHTAGRLELITAGILKSGSAPDTGSRLLSLKTHLEDILRLHHPIGVAIETLYFSKNTKTALAVAESRGVLLATIAAFKLPLIELNPNEVKSFIVGHGRASKSEIAHAVSLLLNQPINALDDVTDALALAILASTTIGTQSPHSHHNSPKSYKP